MRSFVMKCKLAIVGAVTFGLFLVGAPVFAHHAQGTYDRDHPITVTGTVTEFEFINPHVRIHFDVKDENGVVVHWVAETAPPQRLFRVGWNRNSLKPGDSITITGFPSKDGKKTMGVRKLVPPGGGALTEGNE
jgi:uncharacterized protein DUF6152